MAAAPANPDFREDFRRLGAPVGCDIEHLKRCYRRVARQLHPDLRPVADEAADEALTAVNAAYRRLLAFHREHGRLPGQAPASAPRVAAVPAIMPEPVATRRNGIGGRAAMLGVLLLAGLWALGRFGSSDTAPEVVPDTTPAEHPPALPPSLAAESSVRASLRPIRIGDTKTYVRRVLGDPPLADDSVWEYGPSHVRFVEGRVAGWYSSPLAPIAVDED